MPGRSRRSTHTSPSRGSAWSGSGTTSLRRSKNVTLPALGHATLLTLAVLSTAATFWLLFSLLRPDPQGTPRRRRDRRGRPVGRVARGEPGEALALVGGTLAATHDPSALLPIILEVVVDATEARGGRIVAAGEEVSWTGETHGGPPPLMIELT